MQVKNASIENSTLAEIIDALVWSTAEEAVETILEKVDENISLPRKFSFKKNGSRKIRTRTRLKVKTNSKELFIENGESCFKTISILRSRKLIT